MRSPVHFGPFVFNLENGTLTNGGSSVALGNRAAKLLEVLLDRRGQTVSKADLMEAAWPGTFVEESNLSVQIAALRKALTANPDDPSWINTVSRVGYRFASNVAESAETAARTAPTSPVVAVLPFTNMSSDPEQDYFADGIADDLITDLSKMPGLTVIARNSSFGYRGPSVDIRLASADLGARYIIEGSVRRAAGTIRITAQLVDATTLSHLWAERFDRELADVFALQDEIVGRIADALASLLPPSPKPVAKRTANLEAYDLFVRGRVLVTQVPEDNRAALPILEKAIALDPDFAEAHAWLAVLHLFGSIYLQAEGLGEAAQARLLAQRAVELDPRNSVALWVLGYVHAYDGHLARGIAEMEAALKINPNHADAWAMLADLKVLDGRVGEAVNCAENAFRLNPYPPSFYYWALGLALHAARRYEDSLAPLSRDGSRVAIWRRILAASLARLGRMEEARAEAVTFMASFPDFTIERWAATQPFRNARDMEHFAEGYRAAGLPQS